MPQNRDAPESRGELVDHAGAVDADKADLVAVSAVRARYVRQPAPTRAILDMPSRCVRMSTL